MPTPTMAERLYPHLTAGNWQAMLEVCRNWYAAFCPRYSRYEVESALVWVGRMLIVQHHERKNLTQPEFDDLSRPNPLHTTPERVEAVLRKQIDSHFANELGTYRRFCERHDAPEPAEKKVAEIADRVVKMTAAASVASVA